MPRQPTRNPGNALDAVPTLGDRLRALMASRGTTQAKVAAEIGMSRQQLGQILTGEVANPGILTVQRIVEATGATMADLFTTTENMP